MIKSERQHHPLPDSRYIPVPQTRTFVTAICQSRETTGVMVYEVRCSCVGSERFTAFSHSWEAYDFLVKHARGHQAALVS